VNPPAPRGPAERDGEVPRLPRGPLVKLSGPALMRIGMIAIVLLAVIGLRRPCADGVAGFISGFDAPDAGPRAAPPMQLERLTEDEIKRRFPSAEEIESPGPEREPPETPRTPGREPPKTPQTR
jgi:hypothetical protein